MSKHLMMRNSRKIETKSGSNKVVLGELLMIMIEFSVCCIASWILNFYIFSMFSCDFHMIENLWNDDEKNAKKGPLELTLRYVWIEIEHCIVYECCS